MKKNTAKDYAVALYNATQGLSETEMKKVVRNFCAALLKLGLLKQGDKIISEFEKYSKKQQGIVDIEVTSAQPLEKSMVEKIKKVFGKEANITEKRDAEILGGVKIKTENMVFDGSLKKQLEMLKKQLS